MVLGLHQPLENHFLVLTVIAKRRLAVLSNTASVAFVWRRTHVSATTVIPSDGETIRSACVHDLSSVDARAINVAKVWNAIVSRTSTSR